MNRHTEHLLAGGAGALAGLAGGTYGLSRYLAARRAAMARSRGVGLYWLTVEFMQRYVQGYSRDALPVLQAAMEKPNSFLVVSEPVPPEAAALGGNLLVSYRDAQALSARLAAGGLQRSISGVLLDLEPGTFGSPAQQVVDPAPYLVAAASSARQSGVQFWFTPAASMAVAMAHPAEYLETAQRSAEAAQAMTSTGPLSYGLYYQFLNSGLVPAAAPLCHGLIIQAYDLELTPFAPVRTRQANRPSLVGFTRQFSAQARGANPKVQVWLTLQAYLGSRAIPQETLVAIAQATAPYVDGYLLLIPQEAAVPAASQVAGAYSLLSLIPEV